MLFKIWPGLDIPIRGAPLQEVSHGAAVTSVAVLGDDFVGLRPRLLVREGDRVRLGQALFVDRRRPDVRYTAPGGGEVARINRGRRRVLESVVVRLGAGEEEEVFTAHPHGQLPTLRREEVVENLLVSGLWTAFRGRPYGAVADPAVRPSSIFVTALESDPLAPAAEVVIGAARQDFEDGLAVICHLTEGPVYLCTAQEADVPRGDPARVTLAEFTGPHPAGLPGTHIHCLDPVGRHKVVWHADYQDVIAIGRLFTTGRLSTERIVSLGGPLVSRPRLVRTRAGACIEELIAGEVPDDGRRVISGSVLSGRAAAGPTAYLGRYHRQVSVIAEAGGRKRGRFSTALHGRETAFVPTLAFESVMPLDVLAVPLLRSLIIGDAETARALGCLELCEEDVALLSYVCPGKHDYGSRLRSVLAQIEKEG